MSKSLFQIISELLHSEDSAGCDPSLTVVSADSIRELRARYEKILVARYAETSIHFATGEPDPPSTRYLNAYCTDSNGTIRRATVAEDLTGAEADELHTILTAHAAKIILQ